MPKFIDERNRTVSEDEVTNLFRYEDFLKSSILGSGVGKLALENLRNSTFKKIYVVPAGN